VSRAQAQTFATGQGLLFFETAAKIGTGITEAFTRLSMQIVEKVKASQIQESAATRPPIAPPERDRESTGCPC
jgi:hypothetical protein